MLPTPHCQRWPNYASIQKKLAASCLLKKQLKASFVKDAVVTIEWLQVQGQ
jgi:hypothetical protein